MILLSRIWVNSSLGQILKVNLQWYNYFDTTPTLGSIKYNFNFRLLIGTWRLNPVSSLRSYTFR